MGHNDRGHSPRHDSPESSSRAMDDMEARLDALLDTPMFGTAQLLVLAGVSERTAQRFLREIEPDHTGPWRLTRRQLLRYALQLEGRKSSS